MLHLPDFDELEKIFKNQDPLFSHEQLENLVSFEMLENIISNDMCSRHFFLRKFGIFGFPSIEGVHGILNYAKEYNISTIIDVGAGFGYLSYGLDKVQRQHDMNINVVAVDNKSFFKSAQLHQWYPVIETNAVEFLKDKQNSLIVLCWPNYKSDFAFDVADILHESNKMIYIGESSYGCTANDNFFDNFEINKLAIPWTRWWAIHDDIYEVRKKT